jgi:hypothetical protein
MIDELDNLTIDWSNFEYAGEQTRDIVRRLSDDKATLRKLVYAVEDNPALMASCERHQLLDYIVIYDATSRGFRIRVHLSTEDARDRPHDHRFSFSSNIICGQYTHIFHKINNQIYKGEDADARKWMNLQNPDPRTDIDIHDLEPQLIREERAGSCYTLHHSVVHTTVTTPNTVSLFLRGPAEKDRSIIMDKATSTYWWRFGQQDEPDSRRNQKRMTSDQYRDFRSRIEQLGVI